MSDPPAIILTITKGKLMDYQMAEQIKMVAQISLIDNKVLEKARDIVAGISEGIDLEELSNLLFEYSGTLAASVATSVSLVCLGENKFNQMAESLETHEAEQLVKDIEAWLN
jgi:hypothetical protein